MMIKSTSNPMNFPTTKHAVNDWNSRVIYFLTKNTSSMDDRLDSVAFDMEKPPLA